MGSKKSLISCTYLHFMQIGIIDPDSRLIGLHLYDRLFKEKAMVKRFEIGPPQGLPDWAWRMQGQVALKFQYQNGKECSSGPPYEWKV
ncbi:hypothetical protein REPUB_Repub08aG0021700 [Reevesia pubescens]